MTEFFSRTEAESKINKLVVSLQAFSGVPKYTVGEVTRIYGDKNVWGVDIKWEFPHTKKYREKPLVDGFTKSEYEQFLLEIGTIR